MPGPSSVAVSADHCHRAEAQAVLSQVLDPCSLAMGIPLNLMEMGIVDRIQVSSGRIEVTLLPTSFACLFVGVLQNEIRTRLERLDWSTVVEVNLTDGDDDWDESRMALTARSRLEEYRELRRLRVLSNPTRPKV